MNDRLPTFANKACARGFSTQSQTNSVKYLISVIVRARQIQHKPPVTWVHFDVLMLHETFRALSQDSKVWYPVKGL